MSGDGVIAALLLADLSTAGIHYANVVPVFVSTLESGYHLSTIQAGGLVSFNLYASVVGALTAAVGSRWLPWKPAAGISILVLTLVELLSQFSTPFQSLVLLRTIHGLAGGILLGVVTAVVARVSVPDRAFAVITVFEFLLSGLGIMLIPSLTSAFGPRAMFITLAALTASALIALPLLPAYAIPNKARVASSSRSRHRHWALVLMALFALAIFQAGRFSLQAHMVGVGIAMGLDESYIDTSLGIATWLSLIGCGLVIFVGLKHGRFWPLTLTLAIGAVMFEALLLNEARYLVWASSAVIAGIASTITLPYLRGLASALDGTGRVATWSSAFSMLGLATGPAAGGFLVAAFGYRTLIEAAVGTMALCAVMAALPAQELDRAGLKGAAGAQN